MKIKCLSLHFFGHKSMTVHNMSVHNTFKNTITELYNNLKVIFVLLIKNIKCKNTLRRDHQLSLLYDVSYETFLQQMLGLKTMLFLFLIQETLETAETTQSQGSTCRGTSASSLQWINMVVCLISP